MPTRELQRNTISADAPHNKDKVSTEGKEPNNVNESIRPGRTECALANRTVSCQENADQCEEAADKTVEQQLREKAHVVKTDAVVEPGAMVV